MARNDTVEAEVTEPATNGATEAAAKTVVKAKDLPADERVSMMFGMPAGLKAQVEAEAEKGETTAAALVRNLVAEKFGYTLPVTERTGRAKKYGSDEEKDKVKKEKGKGRRALIRALLEKYTAGDVEIPGEIAALAAAAGIKPKAATSTVDDGEDEDEDEADEE